MDGWSMGESSAGRIRMKASARWSARFAAYADTLSPRVHALISCMVLTGYAGVAWWMHWSLWQFVAITCVPGLAVLAGVAVELANVHEFDRLRIDAPPGLRWVSASRVGATVLRTLVRLASRLQVTALRIGRRATALLAVALLGGYLVVAYSSGWGLWKSLAILLLLVDMLLVLVVLRLADLVKQQERPAD